MIATFLSRQALLLRVILANVSYEPAVSVEQQASTYPDERASTPGAPASGPSSGASGPAADAAAAEAAIASGIRLRRERRDAEALIAFQRAHALAPSPRTLAQVALAEQALGQWVHAEAHLNAALRAADDPWIAARVTPLRAALAKVQQHLGSLVVVANVPGGQLSINEEHVGELPLAPLRVVAGKVVVEVRWKDQPPFRETIDVPAGGTVTERIQRVATLTPSPAGIAAAQGAASSSKAAAPLHAEASGGPTRAQRELSSDAQRTLGVAALGASGSFLVGALAAAAFRAERAARYNDDARCFYGELTRNQRCGKYRGQADSAEYVAITGFIAAGVLGAAGAVLLVTAPSGARPSTGTRPQQSAHPSPNLGFALSSGSATAWVEW